MSSPTAEQVALQGLLLIVVEVTNILCNEELDAFEKLGDIEDVVEADATRELVQLARAALSVPRPATIPVAAASVHA